MARLPHNSGESPDATVESHMSKLKISAKQVLNDINAGMSNADLMEKYGVSPKGLDALFRKLADAGLLKEASLNQMPVAPKQEPPKRSEYAAIHPTGPTIQPQQKPDDTLTRIAEDVRNGLHDGEIMRRYELSPGMLREMKEKLVQKGYLESDQAGHEEIKRTRTCPSCSREIPQSAGKCVHCGAWLDAGPPEVSDSGPSPVAESPEVMSSDYDREDEKECAWEERANYGTTKALFMTATECLMRPTKFFSNLPLEGGYFNPILFAVMSGVMGVVLGYLWTSLFSGGLLGLVGLLFLMAFVFVASLITLPIIILAFSALLHGSLFLVKGANEGFQTTFRVVSYSWVTTLFNALPIPYLGSIASLWGLVLMAIGVRETHKTSTGKAAAAVLISVAVVVAVLAIFFAGALSAAFSGAKTAKVPPEVCSALRTFVDKVDAAADLDDAAAQAELKDAGKELDEVLKRFQNQKEVAQLRGQAVAYQMGVVIQRKLAKAGGSHSGMNQLQGGLEQQRDALLACSPMGKGK